MPTSPAPVFEVGLELAAGSYTLVTDDCAQFTIAREISDLFRGITIGTIDIALENWTGNYSPENPASPYAGLLRPNIGVRVRATHQGSTFGLFNGVIDEFTMRPAMDGGRMMTIRGRDRLKNLRNISVRTDLFENVKVQSLFAAVLSQAAFTSSWLNIDTLGDEVPFAWFNDVKADNALEAMLNSGFYFGYATGDGILRIRSRYADQEGAVQNSLSTFFDMEYALNDDDVFNDILVDSAQRRVATNPSTLAWIDSPIAIPASGGIGFFLEYLDPDTFQPTAAVSLQAVTAGSDYTVNTQSGGGGSDVTSSTTLSIAYFGASAVASLFNATGATVYLNKFQIRGTHIERTSRISVRAENNSSQAFYGKRDFTVANDLIGLQQEFSQNYADFLLARNKDAVSQIGITIRNDWPMLLERDLGDLIHIVNSVTGVGSTFSIASVEHTVSFTEGMTHDATYGIQRFRDREVLILDHPVYGVLDTRRLGF